METDTSSSVTPLVSSRPVPANIPPVSRIIAADRHLHGSHTRHGYHAHFRRGRMWVVALFFAFRLTEMLQLLPYWEKGSYSPAVSILVACSVIWSTALLAGIWMRQAWARLCLIVWATAMLGVMVYRLAQTSVVQPERIAAAVLGTPGMLALLYGGMIVVLVRVRALRRLTNQSYA